MRVKTEALRLSFVQAAGQLFAQSGYASVTMEAIAAQAGRSKVTLYGYFPSKESLFEAFVVESGREAMERIEQPGEQGDDIRDTLARLGLSVLQLVTRAENIALHRLIISESPRVPTLAQIFYDNGRGRLLAAIAEIMTREMAHGALRAGDPHVMTLHFKALCESGMVERLLWNLPTPREQADLQRAVDRAVTVFLDGYGP